MAEQSWLKVWARTIGMPIGETDTDPPKDPAISKTNVKRGVILGRRGTLYRENTVIHYFL